MSKKIDIEQFMKDCILTNDDKRQMKKMERNNQEVSEIGFCKCSGSMFESRHSVYCEENESSAKG